MRRVQRIILLTFGLAAARAMTGGVLAAAVVLIAAPSITGCTARSPRLARRGVDSVSQHVLEQVTRDRWLHAAQRSEFTPFARAVSTLYLELGPDDRRTGERTIRVHMQRAGSGDSALVTVRADGRVVRQEAWLRPVPSIGILLPGDSARMTRFRLLVGGRLALPLARVWDLVPPVHPARFVFGARWADTIALATELEGSRQSLAGVRTSTILGDTVIAGRRLWVIGDSANVRYTERELQQERTLDTLAAVERSATGTIRGTYLYDHDLGLPRQRDDTTSLAGDAVLRYPDGRSFRTPARYERTRGWTLYDPAAYAARVAALRAERERTSTGPVRTPRNETERRLASGDSALTDSLTAAWERERNPDRREELYRLLRTWGSAARAPSDLLDGRRVVAGDSAFILRQLARRAYPAAPPIGVDVMRHMIRIMADPGLPFALGVSRDALYESLVQTLVTWPPALTPDTFRWRCVPEACRLLGEQWRSAREPRLRDVGLTALVTVDPARWSDTAVARAAAGSPMIVRAVQLANGVGATWPVAAKLTLPEAGADWRAWMMWANANDPRYRPPSPPPRVSMRFEESHATAIRFYQLRTGRDVIGELRRQFAAATDDSARLVFGTIVSGLGDALPTTEQIAAQFRSGSALQITLAERSLRRLFGARALLADSTTAIALIDRLIASSVDGTEPWQRLRAPSDSSPRVAVPGAGAPRVQTPPPRLYVLADSVPPVLREKWRDRVRFIGQAEWLRMPEREPATLLTLSSVERIGPFARVRAQTAGRLPRRPDEAVHLFYSGTSFYLLASGNGWLVVSTDMWIT